MRLLRLLGGIVVCVAALLRVLSVVLVVYRDLALQVRCWSYHVSVMLPTLGGYMREVALFALCCSFLSMYLNAIILGLLERKSLLNLIISWMASLSQELLLQLLWVYALPTTYLGTNIVTTFAKRQILLLAYLDVFYLAVPPK